VATDSPAYDVISLPARDRAPSVSVVIATRNRAGAVVETIESIVRNEDLERALSFEVIVVDQSDDDASERAVAPYLRPDRVQYLRTQSRGLGAARNAGVAAAASEWVAFTDDDCTVGRNWLPELRRALDLDARIGVVFGRVTKGPHDPDAGFIPSYQPQGTFVARSLAEKHRVEGIGACMALRKSVWTALGGFDSELGAGSRFHSAEELDFVIRALEGGYWVHETDQAEVIHMGFRPNARKSSLAYEYCFGIGAVYTKHLKCRRWQVLRPLLQLARRWSLGNPVVSYGKPPDKTPRLRGFLEGALTGWRTPVNRHAALYRPDQRKNIR
jgi:GT2 family glycosyltransferase